MTAQWHIDPEELARAQRMVQETEAAHAEIARRLLEVQQYRHQDLYALYWQAVRDTRPEPRFYWSNPGYGERCVKRSRVLTTAAFIFGLVAFIDWHEAIGGFLACTVLVGTMWVLDCLAGVHRMKRRR